LENFFPYLQSVFIYIGLAIISFGVFLLFYMIIKAFINTLKKNNEKSKKQSSPLIQSIKLISVLLLIVLGFAIFFFGMFVQSVTTFTKKTLVAEVWCKEVDLNDYTMSLVLVKKQGVDANIARPYLIKGDQWFVRGDVIKWENWVNFMGLHTGYRLTRIGGDFIDLEDQEKLKPSNYSLLPAEESGFWKWLIKFGYKIPIINDVYGNASFKYPAKNKKFNVYVTTSGFSIETEDENADK